MEERTPAWPDDTRGRAHLASKRAFAYVFFVTLDDPLVAFRKAVRCVGAAFPYQIGARLGEGGFGVVHEVERHTDKAALALKLIMTPPGAGATSRARFNREIETLRALEHPNIVKLIEAGWYGHVLYIVMERCGGGDAESAVEAKGGSLPPEEAIRILLDASTGVAPAHDQNIIHRDIKPANVLLTDANVAKVSDFGLAKNLELAGLSGFTRTGDAWGTCDFMPPEQVVNFKYLKPTGDVWSLGATLYFLLTGALTRDFPAGQDPCDVAYSGPIVPIRQRRHDLPEGLTAVVDRALARRPEDRYASAGSFCEALARLG